MAQTANADALKSDARGRRSSALRFTRRAAAAVTAVFVLGNHAHAQVYSFAPLAGNPAVLDHTDGTGTNARFFNPTAAAVDAAGNIYVADGGDHTVRKISAGGTVTTLAGSSGHPGSSDGSGSGAQFLYPYAVAVDGSGNVYVADSGNHNIRRVTPGGTVSTVAGTAGSPGSMDGTGTAALFNTPQGIAVDAMGNVYVSDTNNSTVRRITPAGVVTTLAGAAGQSGGSDGTGSSARFSYPYGLASDAAGNVYVADLGNSTIRKLTPGGVVSTLAGSAGQSGSADGAGGSARFNHPSAVALDTAGNVYVADTSNQTVREISPAGTVTTLAGAAGIGGNADGSGPAASFFYPGGIASTGAGTLYIADTGNHTLRVMDSPGAVATLAGSAGEKGSADGTGTQALFAYPYGISSDGSGHLYVADSGNNTVRKVSTAGVVTTFAGTAGVPPGSANGVGSAAAFSNPAGTAADGNGNVYVADAGNSTIRKISSGGAVTTFAGVPGVAGSTDGTGAAALFNAPNGVAVDTVGNVYVADTKNDTIRKITAGGTVTTLAGVAGQTGSGDGPGGSARFNGPYAVAVDGAGNVYVADFFNATIRKIDTSGTVSTLAGTAGQLGYTDATGFLARFNQPYGLAVDASGNVFVADTYNRAIRKVTPGGVVSTLNGAQTRFYYPQGIAIDAAGNLYVSDGDDQAVFSGAVVTAPPAGSQVASASITAGQNASFTVGVSGTSLTYQWQSSANSGATWANVSNGAAFSGATTATLTLVDPPVTSSGDMFQVLLENPAGSSTSGFGTLTVTAATVVIGGSTGSAHLVNLSVRSTAGTGSQTLIAGFVVGGTGSKSVLVRGDGPVLASFGVTGVLPDPVLTLFNSASTVLSSNSGWGDSATPASTFGQIFTQVGAFALPSISNDAAILTSLGTGSYTAEISSTSGDSGVVLVEVYDADAGTPTARFINLSARSQAGTGSQTLIAGFAVTGAGSETVLIRADGPGLAQFSVSGALASPQLTLYDGNGKAIATNVGWSTAPTLGTSPVPSTIAGATVALFTEVGAFQLTAGSGDCALVASLPPGSYTAEVTGANSSTGVALVEIYEVP
jgi:sugar lactone lactonase YvrE